MADRKPTVLNPAGYQENLQDTDNLIVEAAPTAENHAVNKEFVDDLKVVIDGDIADAGKWEESDGKLYPKDLTNKVGIGTDSPTRPLTIAGATNAIRQGIDSTQYAEHYYAGGANYQKARNGSSQGKFVWESTDGSTSIERMRIEASGNVGIGTDSPGEKLSILGADPVLLIQDSETGLAAANSTIRFGESGAGGVLENYWDIGPKPLTNNNFAFNIGGATSYFNIRFDNGNVGIGTDSPGTTLELGTETPVLRLNGTNNGANVYGDIRSTGNGFEFLSRGGASSFGSYAFYNYNGTAESIALKIKSDGNVGIGFGDPKAKLDVYGGILGQTKGDEIDIARFFAADSNTSKLKIFERRFKDGPSWDSATLRLERQVDATSMGYIEFGPEKSNGNPSTDLAIGTGTTEIARFENSGNVGIGNTDPNKKLTVASNIDRGGIAIERTANSDQSVILSAYSGGNKLTNSFAGDNPKSFVISNYDAGENKETNVIIVKHDHKVGVGTNQPEEKLHVVGNIKADNFDIGGITKDSYLRSDAADTASGKITFDAGIRLNDEVKAEFGSSADYTIRHSGNNAIHNLVNGDIYFQQNNTSKVWIDISGSSILPYEDNSGNVGTTGNTWNNGRFTNFTVDSTLTVKGAIDLADSDILRFGSGDDVAMYYNGTHFYTDLKTTGNYYIRDNTTTRFTFNKSGDFTATGAIYSNSTVRGASRVQAGTDGNGAVALTINDGGGNANLTFNHAGNAADQDGNAFRISGNTDQTSSATLTFTVYENIQQGAATGASSGTMHLRPQGLDVSGKVTADQFDLESLPPLP